MFEVIVEAEFCAAHALRHYHGRTEPLHGHNYRVQVVVRGKRLQKKVKYLVDFIPLRKALQAVVQRMDHTNLNELPPFDRENPSAESLAVYIAGEIDKIWSDPGGKIAAVTVWETSSTAARYIPGGAR